MQNDPCQQKHEQRYNYKWRSFGCKMLLIAYVQITTNNLEALTSPVIELYLEDFKIP